MQADARFFTDLVQRLRPILEAKGFRLTRHVYMPKSFGHRIATFEGPAFIVDAAWEGRDREINCDGNVHGEGKEWNQAPRAQACGSANAASNEAPLLESKYTVASRHTSNSAALALALLCKRRHEGT